jgi:hypothetical protein
MLRRILAVAAFSSLVSVAAPVSHVLACSCVQLGAGDALANADVAFVGVITGIDNPQDPQAELGNDPIRYTFAVEEVAKGQLGATLDVRSSPSSASCGQEFGLAQRWRVFAYADENGQLLTGLCSGNELLDERAPIPAPPSNSPPTALLLAIGGVIVLAAFSAWAFTRKGLARGA